VEIKITETTVSTEETTIELKSITSVNWTNNAFGLVFSLAGAGLMLYVLLEHGSDVVFFAVAAAILACVAVLPLFKVVVVAGGQKHALNGTYAQTLNAKNKIAEHIAARR
jgi:hypothetical protein